MLCSQDSRNRRELRLYLGLHHYLALVMALMDDCARINETPTHLHTQTRSSIRMFEASRLKYINDDNIEAC